MYHIKNVDEKYVKMQFIVHQNFCNIVNAYGITSLRAASVSKIPIIGDKLFYLNVNKDDTYI